MGANSMMMPRSKNELSSAELHIEFTDLSNKTLSLVVATHCCMVALARAPAASLAGDLSIMLTPLRLPVSSVRSLADYAQHFRHNSHCSLKISMTAGCVKVFLLMP